MSQSESRGSPTMDRHSPARELRLNVVADADIRAWLSERHVPSSVANEQTRATQTLLASQTMAPLLVVPVTSQRELAPVQWRAARLVRAPPLASSRQGGPRPGAPAGAAQ